MIFPEPNQKFYKEYTQKYYFGSKLKLRLSRVETTTVTPHILSDCNTFFSNALDHENNIAEVFKRIKKKIHMS